MNILIAEDDFTSRTLLSGVLKNMGHEVVETARGTDAWKILQNSDAPRLAVLDWMMPDMDGLEVVRQVRSLKTDRPPYLILLTARGEKSDIIVGLEAGADDYLAKPFDAGELRARVEVGRRMIEIQDALIQSREILAHQAAHDPLTGMLNNSPGPAAMPIFWPWACATSTILNQSMTHTGISPATMCFAGSQRS